MRLWALSHAIRLHLCKSVSRIQYETSHRLHEHSPAYARKILQSRLAARRQNIQTRSSKQVHWETRMRSLCCELVQELESCTAWLSAMSPNFVKRPVTLGPKEVAAANIVSRSIALILKDRQRFKQLGYVEKKLYTWI